MAELLPCPFCGGEAKIVENGFGFADVSCKKRGCRGYAKFLHYTNKEGEKKMARYIDINNINLRGIAVFDQDFEALIPLSDVRKALQMTPTADVQEVRHGRWISNDLGGYKWAYYCSECGWVDGYPFNDRHKYCPNCGAKMDGEREIDTNKG